MNFVFLFPNVLNNYHNYTVSLRKRGVTTLGIGEEPFEELSQACRDSLVDYYQVESLETYEEVFKACAFFSFKYGKIDWLESNDEYWLQRDARLRTDFHITTGLRNDRIEEIKYKSKMKKYYALAGVPTARYHLVESLSAALDFVQEVGYPVVVKPDNGVGANDTYKLTNEEEVRAFYKTPPKVPYIMEEYINGTLMSYDGISDAHRNVVFETCHYFPDPIMEVVNEKLDVWYYSKKRIPQALRDAGRRTIQAFDSQCRFFHCEFFILNEDKEGLGKRGDVLGLEVNMRPAGGYTTDMINSAMDTNIYDMWADMVCNAHEIFEQEENPYVSVFTSQRKGKNYAHRKDEIFQIYGEHIIKYEELHEVIAVGMGDYAFMAKFKTEEEAELFANFVLERA